MNKELPKVYDPQQVEGRIYQMWMDGDCFNGDPDPKKKPFSISMPPPNVTGQLHMGHVDGEDVLHGPAVLGDDIAVAGGRDRVVAAHLLEGIAAQHRQLAHRQGIRGVVLDGYVTFFRIILDKTRKMCGLFANCD